MSSENLTEMNGPELTDAAPRRRPLWRRLLKWTLVSVGVLLVLVILTVLFFHTGPGKEIARGIVEDGLAKRYDGTVTLGGLDYALFGDVAIDELKVVDRAGTTALHLKHLELALDWGALIGGELVIDRLAVDGVDVDTATLKAVQREPTKLPGTATIHELDVKHVNATLTRPDGGVTRITDLAIHGRVAINEAAASADVSIDRFAAQIALALPNGTRVAFPLATGIDASRRGANVSLKTRAIATTVHLEVPDQPPRDVPLTLGALDVTADATGARLDFAGLGAGPLAVARIHGDVRFDAGGKPAGPQRLALEGVVIAAAGVEELLGRPVLASDVRADVAIAGPPAALVVTGDVTTDGGKLALRGTVDASDPLSPSYDLRLVGTDIDTSKLLANPRSPVQTSLELTLKGKGIKPGALTFDAHFALGPTTVAGRPLDGLALDASAHGSTFAVNKLTIDAFGQRVEVTGSLDRETRRFSAHIKTVAGLADALAKARLAGLLLIPLPPVAGSLDIDLVAEGTLAAEGVPLVEAATASGGIVQLAQLPIERMTLKGHVNGTELLVTDPIRGEMALGALKLAADLALADNKPTGTLSVDLTQLDAGATKLDEATFAVTLDGLAQHIIITAKDARQQLDARAVLDALIDPTSRTADATLQELAVKRGAADVRLLAPVTVHVAPPDPSGDQAYTLPTMRFSLAGGSLSVGGTARFRQDPANPGATLLSHASGTLDFSGLSIGQLAALARRNTFGVGGTVSGTVGFDGTLAAPAATFGLTVRARAKRAAAALVSVQGSLQDSRLRADVRVTDAASKTLIAHLNASAPLLLAVGRPPALAPGGALRVALDVPKRRLGSLAPLLPMALPAGTDLDATLAAHADFSGTPGRPTGDFSLSVEGGLIPPGKLPDQPARQRLTVDGKLAQRTGGVTAFEGRVMAWLDAAAPQLIDVMLNGEFARSPALRNGLAKTWRFDINLQPIDLARLPLPPSKRVAGSFSGAIGLSGEGGDLFGHGGFALSQLKIGDNPSADVSFDFSTDQRTTTIELQVGAGGMDVLALQGTLGIAGAGLRTGLRARLARIAATPIALTLTVPKRSLAQWATLGPKPVTLAGDFGGAVIVSGTLGAPVVQGELGWDGFTTLAGTPGRVALVIDADGERAHGGFEIGPRGPDGVAPVRFALGAEPGKVLKRQPFDLTVTGRATGVDLLSLFPEAVADGKRIDVAGMFDCDVDGLLRLVPEGETVRIDAAASRLGGGLTARDVRAPLPGSDRSIHDGLLRLSLAMDKVGLTLRAREKDAQRDDRSLALEGRLALDGLRPTTATLDVTTKDWLILGLGLDNPEGELDLAAKVTATKLLEPVKDIDVLVSAVDLYAPERFVRAHFQQFTSYGDVVYLDESGMPSGKLKPPPLPEPPPAAAPADSAAPPGGFDVHLRIPEPIHVLKDPLTVDLKGGLEVALRGKSLTIDGRLDVVDGAINVMGWSWPLVRGAITVDGGLETFLAALTFRRPPHPAALRDIAVRDDETLQHTYITVTIDMVHGQQIHFAGAAGPYLLDVATLLNTGRAVYWSRADLPASLNVQFGQPEQGLVNTFVQTNLRQLIFMDRANGWSEPVDDPGQYGRIWNFAAERYLAGDGQRVRFVTRAPGIGQNHVELQYDLLFAAAPRSVAGVGARFGDELRLGLGLFWELWSRD